MNKRRCYDGVVVRLMVLFVAGATRLLAGEGPSGTKWALILGVDAYQDTSFSRIIRATSHGRQVASILRQQYGYANVNIIELYNRAATEHAVYDAIARIRGSSSNNDSFFGYFAVDVVNGEDVGEAYLVPVDGVPNEPWTMVTHRAFEKYFGNLRSMLLAFEDCYDPNAADMKRQYMNAPPVPPPSRGRAGGSYTLTYCGEDVQPVLRQHMAELFIEALGRAPINARGTVTLSDLKRTVASRIKLADSLGSGTIIVDGYGSEFNFVPQYDRPTLNAFLVGQLESGTSSPREKIDAISGLTKMVVGAAQSQKSELTTAFLALLHSIVDDSSADAEVQYGAARAMAQLQQPGSFDHLARLFEQTRKPVVRKIALEAMVQIKRDSTFPFLRRGLRDADPLVRITAVREWSKTGDGSYLPALLEFLPIEKTTEVRLAALESLPKSPASRDQVWSLLQTMENSPEASIRRGVTNAASRLDEYRLLPGILRRLQTDPDTSVRQSAAFAAGRMFREQERIAIEDGLIEALENDENVTVREAVVYSLGNVHGERAGEALLDAFDDEEKVRRTAIEVLGNMQYHPALSDLARLVREDESANVRVAAATALGKLGDEKALGALFDAVNDADLYVSAAAAEALQGLGTVPVVPRVVEALKDKNAKARAEAAQLLSRTRDPLYTDELIQLLRDSDPIVRQTAADGLSSYTDEFTINRLVSALDDENSTKRQGVAVILGRLRRPEVVEPLLRHKDDPHSGVRAEVIRSLGKYTSDPRVLDVLKKALKDPDPAVREAAASAVGMYYPSMKK